MEGTALVGQAEHGADLVAAGPQLQHRGHHHKPGVVHGVIVDPLGQNMQPIDLGGPAGADGGGGAVAAFGHLLGRAGGVQGGHPPPAPVGVQILLALHQPLLVGVDRVDVLQRHAGQGHQAVLHLHLALPHHVVVVLGQQIVDLPDGAGGGILHREHRIVGLPPLQGSKHVGEPGQPPAGHLRAEEAHGGLLAVAPRLPLVDHPGGGHRLPPGGQGRRIGRIARFLRPLPHQLALLPAGNGHDLLVEGRHVRLAGRIAGEGCLGGDHLLLPPGVQHRDTRPLLVLPHLAGDRHPLQKELHQLPVDAVDLLAVLLQFGHVPSLLCLRDAAAGRFLSGGCGHPPLHLNPAARSAVPPLRHRAGGPKFPAPRTPPMPPPPRLRGRRGARCRGRGGP